MGSSSAPTNGDGWEGRRPEMHQAAGMLTGQLGVSIDEAFTWLRTYSDANNRPMIDVARDIVHRRLTAPSPTDLE